jgi:L-rhamnose mutarotase
MNRTVVQYRVKPEFAAENERLVSRVYDGLQSLQPDGVHYATFLLEDDQTFVHVATFENEASLQAFLENEAFTEFQQGIAERCEMQPTASTAREIGAYRFGNT